MVLRETMSQPLFAAYVAIIYKRGQGNIHFPYSAGHEQDWHHYPVDPYSCYMCEHT